MKPSEILRKAAQVVERDRSPDVCGCWALCVVTTGYGGYHAPESVMCYFRMVAPADDLPRYVPWWRGESEKDERIIGLCLAAAIAESEGQ